jgi:chemotaxis signal transduction protein
MSAGPGKACAEDLELVLFRVGGLRYGVDARQVACIEDNPLSARDGLRWFHEILGLPGGAVTYLNPVVLTLHGWSTGIIVDGLEDIVRIPLSDLSPFPSLTESAARAKGLWAVAKRDEQLILLLDFDLLSAPVAQP